MIQSFIMIRACLEMKHLKLKSDMLFVSHFLYFFYLKASKISSQKFN